MPVQNAQAGKQFGGHYSAGEIFRSEIFVLSSVIGRVLIPQTVEDLTSGHLLGLRLAVPLPRRSSSTRSVVFVPPGQRQLPAR